ncbi:hypothetical protein BJX70DRAFT_111730 [Aspergillus crustosus]
MGCGFRLGLMYTTLCILDIILIWCYTTHTVNMIAGCRMISLHYKAARYVTLRQT